MIPIRAFPPLALLLSWALAAHAADAPADASPDTAPSSPDASTLRFNGFGTFGVLGTSPADAWGYRREITQPGHHDDAARIDADTRLGLQLDWRPAPQWEAVGQVVIKPEPAAAPTLQDLMWAFVAWHPTTDWTIRAGRTSPDLFLLADARNVGYSYLWARPSVEYYSWVPLEHIDGIDIAHSGEALDGRWTAKAFVGRTQASLGSNHDDGDTVGKVDPFAGATLDWQRDGWQLKASYAYARTRSLDMNSISMLRGALAQIAAIPVPGVAEDANALLGSIPPGRFITHYAALGAAWDHGPWQLQGEVTRLTGNFMSSQAWYGYGSAGYRIGSNVTVYGMAGRGKSSLDPLPDPAWGTTLAPVIGPVAAAQAQYLADRVSYDSNQARVDQRSLTLGMRWDLGAQVALKLQADRVSSAAYGGGLWAWNTSAPHRANVFSGTLDFVF